MSKEKGVGLEAITFGYDNCLEVPKEFRHVLEDRVVSLFLAWLVM